MRTALLHLALFVCAAMTLLAAARCLDRAYPLLRLQRTEYQAGIPGIPADMYLDYRGQQFGYNAFLYDWGGVTEAARQADVLFLGNSRVIYAFRPEYVQPWLDKIGLSGFVMAFFGGSGYVPLQVIRKYDLRPKMVVINDDDFLRLATTPAGDELQIGAWRAFKQFYRAQLLWPLQKRLHQLVPPLRDFLSTERPQMVIYRSKRNGGPMIAYGQSEGRPLTALPAPEPSDKVRKWIEEVLPRNRVAADEFLQEMDDRGILVVITVLQDAQVFDNYYLARALAERTHRPFVFAMRPDLIGMALGHIDAESSRRLMQDVMPRILALPQVQALARKPAAGSP